MSVEVVGNNVLNNDLAIVEIGEPQGVCQGLIRIGGKVRRKKNLFEDCHLRSLLNPARNSERVCSGGFRPLISLGKTTNVPWQSRCLVEADISKEGLCHRTFIALRVQTIRRRKLLKRSKKWGSARMHSRLLRSRRKWTGPFIGRQKRREMRQVAQWAALLSDCCSAAPYSARWALREFPDCLKPSCFSLARRWAERCLEPLPGQPDFLPRNGFRSRSNAISKRRSVKEEYCSPSRSAALPSAIA